MKSLMEHEQRTLLLLGYNAIKSHVVVHNIVFKYLKSESSQLYFNLVQVKETKVESDWLLWTTQTLSFN